MYAILGRLTLYARGGDGGDGGDVTFHTSPGGEHYLLSIDTYLTSGDGGDDGDAGTDRW